MNIQYSFDNFRIFKNESQSLMYLHGQNLLRIVILFCLVIVQAEVKSQGTCPSNIGFENGNFDNWECSIGTIDRSSGLITLNASPNINDRHTLIKNSYPQALDYYGGFPVNCPNGSGYSIKLGNNQTGAMAESVSYTFTIPADQNNYSLIYDYAVVFQNPPHAVWEQPKFTANVFDVTGGSYIGCSSFSYAASSNLPGFRESLVKDSVFCKAWTPVTIKLSGYAGRTIRLEFTTNDCTRGGHFGYAYVDVNQNCSSPISGNVYCSNAESITLTAPFGFDTYRWFNADFSKILGTGNTLTFNPVPPPDTKYAVEVIPYPGQGCIDTIYTVSVFSGDILNLKVASPVTGCISTGADLTSPAIIAGSTSGLAYAYFTDTTQTTYVPTPKFISKSGAYYIRATNGVGCTAYKKVDVKVEPFPDFKVADPPFVYRPSTVDITKTISSGNATAFDYTYWIDTLATRSLQTPASIDKTGIYFIKGASFSAPACTTTLPVKVQIREPVITPPNVFTPNGDGIHDVWDVPQLQYYPDCIVEIFDRGGKIVFRSVGYRVPWDGKFNGKPLLQDTYYYLFRLTDDLPPVGGSVTILK